MEPEIVGLFPTPVYKVKIQTDYSSVFKWMKSLPVRPTMSNVPGPSPERHDVTVNNYLLHEKRCRALREEIEARITDFMKNAFCFTNPGEVTQSWLNTNKPGDGTHQHAHPNSIISGVWYPELPDGHSSIRFHRHRADHGIFEMRPDVTSSDQMPFWSWDWHEIPVAEGELIMFPSYFRHSVAPNNTNKDRYSLAFNSVTRGSLGNAKDLTEFKHSEK